MNSSKEIIRLIKQLREKRGMSIEELAKMVGVAKSTQSRYESEQRTFPINDVGKYAAALGVTIEYLLGLEVNNEPLQNKYPYYPVNISAGSPLNVDGITNNDVEMISIPDIVMGRWAGNKDVFFMRVNGDSMNRAIPHKSLIAVRKVDLNQLHDGDIVVYSDTYNYSVKRFYRHKGKMIFRPYSNDLTFTDYVVSNCNQNVKIHGKVVLYIVETD